MAVCRVTEDDTHGVASGGYTAVRRELELVELKARACNVRLVKLCWLAHFQPPELVTPKDRSHSLTGRVERYGAAVAWSFERVADCVRIDQAQSSIHALHRQH